MENDSNSCLSNALLWIALAGLVLIVYFLFGDQILKLRSSGGGNPFQGVVDGLAGFGQSLSEIFSGFSR